jgi:hypothetical protein
VLVISRTPFLGPLRPQASTGSSHFNYASIVSQRVCSSDVPLLPQGAGYNLLATLVAIEITSLWPGQRQRFYTARSYALLVRIFHIQSYTGASRPPLDITSPRNITGGPRQGAGGRHNYIWRGIDGLTLSDPGFTAFCQRGASLSPLSVSAYSTIIRLVPEVS